MIKIEKFFFENSYRFVSKYIPRKTGKNINFHKELLNGIERYLNDFELNINKLIEDTSQLQSFEQNESKVLVKTNPTFKEQGINQILEILNPYFPSQQNDLENLIKTGTFQSSKLFFNGNGKTLLDFFKQLMKGQFMIIAVQADFEKWVSNVFEYYYRGEKKKITLKYASTIISGDMRSAKGNRLIDIQQENGKFKIVQLEIKNREQN